jgi:hypothetical protein
VKTPKAVKWFPQPMDKKPVFTHSTSAEVSTTKPSNQSKMFQVNPQRSSEDFKDEGII